jgi:hypothetical protein
MITAFQDWLQNQDHWAWQQAHKAPDMGYGWTRAFSHNHNRLGLLTVYFVVWTSKTTVEWLIAILQSSCHFSCLCGWLWILMELSLCIVQHFCFRQWYFFVKSQWLHPWIICSILSGCNGYSLGLRRYRWILFQQYTFSCHPLFAKRCVSFVQSQVLVLCPKSRAWIVAKIHLGRKIVYSCFVI